MRNATLRQLKVFECVARHASFTRAAAELHLTQPAVSLQVKGLGISFLSAHTLALERQVGNIAVLDVEGFPLLLDWYVVHHRRKRLPPVAAAFRDFLLDQGAPLVARFTRFDPPRRRGPARAARP